MRLLFDQNLSFRLVQGLADLYPDSLHVRTVGLNVANDAGVWDYAGAHGYVIVSKDSDFYLFSLRFGPPPKVVWIRRGNCPTAEIEAILRGHHADIEAFVRDSATALLELM